MIIAWDIENINFHVGIEKLKKVKIEGQVRKFFVHNKKNMPLKVNNFNYLINQKWTFYPVDNKPDAADKKIQRLLKKEMKSHNKIILLTQDHGFSHVIIHMLFNNKKVLLITDNKADKLIRRIEKDIKETKLLKNLEII